MAGTSPAMTVDKHGHKIALEPPKKMVDRADLKGVIPFQQPDLTRTSPALVDNPPARQKAARKAAAPDGIPKQKQAS
jgi:hypothetical protein